MPRSTWRGAVSFGLVSIPVRMYKATESQRVSFRLLCSSCGSPIQNRRWCPNEEKLIGWNDVVRGFEVGREEYVEVTDADLEHLPLASTDTIEVMEMVSEEQIDTTLFLDQAYYLEPEPTGVRPYYLLKQALERSHRTALGKISMRDREHLCRISPHDQALTLSTLRWPQEIRSTEGLRLPEGQIEIQKRELDMALALIDNLSVDFDPSRYQDEYREALLRVVEAKQEHRRPPAREAPARADNVVDLMAALKAAVAQTGGRRRPAEAPARRATTSRKASSRARVVPATASRRKAS
ncbi:MAG TPA: Ku protein [Candidatus Dormibacteraeota bacterium]